MGKQGPHPASVVAIHPRHNLKYDILFGVRGRTIKVTLPRRLGNKFMKYNTVGSTGLLTWKRKRLLDWRPMPVERAPRPAGIQGSTHQARVRRVADATVFISYARTSAEDAHWVASAFEAAGATIWMDDSQIVGGTSLPAAIERGIRAADVFVPVVDDAWFASTWCTRELAMAKQVETRVAPIRVSHGKLRLNQDARRALAGVGDPLILNLRAADANKRLVELASNVLA